MGKGKILLISTGMEIMLIICITAANLNPTPILYFIFYNLLYGLVFSLLIPLYCLYKENGVSVSGSVLAEVGFKKPGIRQWGVLVTFVVFSVGGQLIPKMAAGEQIPWHLLPMGIVPLIMTTFFEELFSLYHLGYPGFRTWADILLLFAVGVGFAAAYKLSGNNLIVSFFVNLPNAFVTYILKYEQFPVMRVSSTIAAAVTLVLIGFATEMLRQLLEVAKNAGMNELYLSVEKKNEPSVKTITRNGGVYERSFEIDGEQADIYRIALLE
nr:CPBP family intramembrane metalloprotease [uncultured Acetatifactor sp.]